MLPASATTTTKTYIVPEDEISKKLPKEVLLRILSYLDVVSLCRCAQVRFCCVFLLLRDKIRRGYSL